MKLSTITGVASAVITAIASWDQIRETLGSVYWVLPVLGVGIFVGSVTWAIAASINAWARRKRARCLEDLRLLCDVFDPKTTGANEEIDRFKVPLICERLKRQGLLQDSPPLDNSEAMLKLLQKTIAVIEASGLKAALFHLREEQQAD